MLNNEALQQLKGSKNLLAFSGGVESTALYYLLHDAGISFDIALVNYHARKQSDEEALSAQQLAEKYNQHCFILDVTLNAKNFEHEARRVRYDFFQTLILTKGYENLITAHQLDDRFEWFLMQISKGAGLVELMGMRPVENEENYTLVRPLLHQSKTDLLAYLKANHRKWFEDASNKDKQYKRNYFRHHHSKPMLEKFQSGIRKSFEFLDEDLANMLEQPEVFNVDELFYFSTPSERRSTLTAIDKTLKRYGFLMRQGDKEQLKEKTCVVVGRRYIVAIGEQYTFIAPFKKAVLEKSFKEACRKLQIEPKLRPYLATSTTAYKKVVSLLEDAKQTL